MFLCLFDRRAPPSEAGRLVPCEIPNSPSGSSNNYARQPSAGRESALEPSNRRSHFHHSIHPSSRPSVHLRNLDRPRRRAEPHMAPPSPDLFRRAFRQLPHLFAAGSSLLQSPGPRLLRPRQHLARLRELRLRRRRPRLDRHRQPQLFSISPSPKRRSRPSSSASPFSPRSTASPTPPISASSASP